MDRVSISGLVATTPRYIETAEGKKILSFRLASSQETFDPTTKEFRYDLTNWYTITGFDNVATNGRDSIDKGDRITLSGLLQIRDWDNGERTGTSVEVIAEHMGHDLAYGTTKFERTVITRQVDEPAKHECDCKHCERVS